MASGGCGVAALSSLGSPRNLVLGGVLFREGWVCCGDALAACAGRGAKPRRASSGRTFDAACGGHFFLSFFLSLSLSLSLSLFRHVFPRLTPPARGHTGLGSFSLMRKRHAWRGGAAGGYPHHAAETSCEAGRGHGEPPLGRLSPLTSHPLYHPPMPMAIGRGGRRFPFVLS